jgi:hypothetical protein
MNRVTTLRRPRTLLPAMLLPALLALAGCSSRAWYEGLRTSAENECRRLPPGGYEDCMARVHRQPYEAYEQERARK